MPLQDLSTSRLTIDRRRAEFADPACEARFLQHCLPERNAQLKTSLLCAAGFYVVFGATDIATLGPTGIAFALIALRVAVALVALGGYLAICRRPESVATSTGASSALLVVALAVFMVVCWYQPGTLPWNVMSQALIVMAVYVNFPNRLGYTVAIGAGSSAVFGAMQVVQGYLKADDVLTLVLLLILSNVLGYLAARRLHLSQREQFCATMLLRQMADRDPLTGCHNRRVLQQGLLAAELARARRYGSALSVVLCDIDHFKRINDTHGHAAGDQVLAGFAGLLQAMTRETVDSVVRYGGEEFLIVLPQTELAGALALAERIRATFASAECRIAEDVDVSATASFGVACVPGMQAAWPLSVDALISAADAQLYAVKHGGRNGVLGTFLFPPPEPVRFGT
ncbi:GGDEF domain-containing protein [Pseudoduganella albidiflava]|uniref:diguanylate cyclase n=1 Tax=Pseudoduganella albidiflava TaxID=321983 RepID=A0A411WXK1_9BURK|nr:GGDEF domain-containing protein [Pseudoduganella albidiflava]QBI01427.1 GGDEF domain-containing protein [Pseudoduganella albidiflava]GGY35752.1 hypothetical protein GCM10007387_17480 [Pseudoduganella albidiflava]